MDKEEFLASGLLEQYVLGIADPDEVQEVERFLQRYPELRQEASELHMAIEDYANQLSIPPPPRRAQEQFSGSTATSTVPSGQINWLNVVVMGALALLCLLTALRMRNLQQQNQELRTQVADCSSREHIIAFLKDSDTEPILLSSSPKAPQAAALVYWNENDGAAMLNPFGLEKLYANEQYQIWADVDGKMISIGLINPNLDKYQNLKYLPNASSLNITIEPRGGSKTPTVSRLVANREI
jgi:anti-sigma-K factor RskA